MEQSKNVSWSPYTLNASYKLAETSALKSLAPTFKQHSSECPMGKGRIRIRLMVKGSDPVPYFNSIAVESLIKLSECKYFRTWPPHLERPLNLTTLCSVMHLPRLMEALGSSISPTESRLFRSAYPIEFPTHPFMLPMSITII